MCVDILFFYKDVIIQQLCFVTYLVHRANYGEGRAFPWDHTRKVSKPVQSAVKSATWQRVGIIFGDGKDRGRQAWQFEPWFFLPLAGWPSEPHYSYLPSEDLPLPLRTSQGGGDIYEVPVHVLLALSKCKEVSKDSAPYRNPSPLAVLTSERISQDSGHIPVVLVSQLPLLVRMKF